MRFSCSSVVSGWKKGGCEDWRRNSAGMPQEARPHLLAQAGSRGRESVIWVRLAALARERSGQSLTLPGRQDSARTDAARGESHRIAPNQTCGVGGSRSIQPNPTESNLRSAVFLSLQLGRIGGIRLYACSWGPPSPCPSPPGEGIYCTTGAAGQGVDWCRSG
jgi:hypothetical protein